MGNFKIHPGAIQHPRCVRWVRYGGRLPPLRGGRLGGCLSSGMFFRRGGLERHIIGICSKNFNSCNRRGFPVYGIYNGYPDVVKYKKGA